MFTRRADLEGCRSCHRRRRERKTRHAGAWTIDSAQAGAARRFCVLSIRAFNFDIYCMGAACTDLKHMQHILHCFPMLWLGARAARAPGGGPRPPVAVAAAPAQCPRPAVRAGQPSSVRRWQRRGQGCRTVAGAGTRTSASLRRRADAPTPFPASAAVGFARGGAGRPGRRGLFFGNFNECSHLLRRDTLVGWRLCGFALFPRTGAALGTTPGRGTLTDWRCLLSRTLLRMWLRAGLALGQHQGFFALRFSQPPVFLPVGFSRGRGFFSVVFSPSPPEALPGGCGGLVFPASCQRTGL